jgi:branched-chain amino acid transport system ATP-binding protein
MHIGIGNLKIIQGISLEVRGGEIVSLMGANGAGKTTFLRALSGLGDITGGTVEFEGQDITHATSQEIVEAGLIQIPEGRQLFPLMSVKENLEIGANTNRAKAKMKENLEYVYTLFPELKEMNSQAAGNLSGGQQQMVAFGRGIMADPKLLILDQPSIGLSPIMTQKVFKAVIDIHIRGVSVLIAEQNIHDVLKIAHRAYVLEQGLIRASGTAKEMAENAKIKAMYLGL